MVCCFFYLSSTARADIEFTFPVSSSEEEELRLIFNWRPATMSSIALEDVSDTTADDDDDRTGTTGPTMTGAADPAPVIAEPPLIGTPQTELLMFALPHHPERMRPTIGSSNAVQQFGCQRNIHGPTCPVRGKLLVIIVIYDFTNYYVM